MNTMKLLIGLCLLIGGCATSPFYNPSREPRAPGFVPRDGFGEPVLSATPLNRIKPASDARKYGKIADQRYDATSNGSSPTLAR